MVASCDARCEMRLRNTEWCEMVWPRVVWCGMMVEMRQCGMCGVVWNVLWNSVMCNFIFECDVHGVVRGGMWAWCDLMVCVQMWWNDLMWIMVRCKMWCVMRCDVECCNFRHGAMWNAIEMQNVRGGIWRGVACGVMVCGMLHNTRCGYLRCDVKCGVVELCWWRMWHMQRAVQLLCDARCGKWCNVLSVM